MPDIWMDVDTALAEVPVNILPLIDDTDFKTIEDAIAYDAAGMDLTWNFATAAGAFTSTSVTPTSAGVHDWNEHTADDGMYTLEIPASGGTINNDTEGTGWFTGVITGVLPFRGPTIGFRAAALNDALIDGGDLLDVNVTHVADTAQTANDIGADVDAILTDTSTTLDNLVDDLESRLGTPSDLGSGATIAANLADIEAQTDDIGVAGAGLTAVPWNANWDAQVESEVTDALNTYDPPTRAELTSDIAGLNDPTAAAIADAVWDETLTGANHNVALSAGRRLRNIQDFGIYDLAATWVDEVAGTSTGTTDGEDATVTNRANDFDNAQTVAASVGLNRIFVANGNSITLSATINNFEIGIPGGNWTLALGGQDIGGCDINDAAVTGIGTGTNPHLHRCLLGAVTLPPSELFHCGIGSSGGTLTVGSAGAYRLIDCYSDVAGSGAPVVDLGAAVGATTMEFRRWSGGLTLNNVQAGDVISVDVVSGGTITVNGTGGTVVIRGLCNVVDGSSGSVTITETSVVNMTKINAEADTAISDAALATAANLATAQADLDTLTGADGATLASAQPNTVAFAAGVTIDNPSGDGLAITSSGGNGDGLSASGNGTGHGLAATGGATGDGVRATGGATSGNGLNSVAATSGSGIVGVGAGGGHGMTVTGNATGEGLSVNGGASGHGLQASGGISAGDGINLLSPSGTNISGIDFDDIGGTIDAAQIGTDAIGAAELAADAVTEIQSGLATAAALTTHDGKLDTVDGIVDDILVDTNELQTDWTNAGRLDAILDELTTQGDTNETAISNLNDISAADILTTALTESYAADGAAPTLSQALFAIQQFLQEKDITTTTMTVKKLDGSTTAMTFTLGDASDPTSITRAT